MVTCKLFCAFFVLLGASCHVTAQWGEWGEWTTCFETRNRGQETEDRDCSVDCQVSEWEMWTECTVTCEGGTRNRTRVVEVEPNQSGMGCPMLSEEEACNTQHCPVDCEVSQWSPWVCDVTCDNGTETRNRTVTVEPMYGGKGCPDLEESQPCYRDPCPVDCEVSPWIAWVCDVSCGTGEELRTREVTTEPMHGGMECPHLNETQECVLEICPVDCAVDEWSQWVCAVTCGAGLATRTRDQVQEIVGDGAACPPLVETGTCELDPCAVDCVIGEWSEWECGVTCGTGTDSRTRNLTEPMNGGEPCPHGVETRECVKDPCPIDCVVGPWSEWMCDVTCDNGTAKRTRDITTEPMNGGMACPHLSETQECMMSPCPVDCVVGPWSEWVCDVTCDNGTDKRTREIITPPMNEGMACPHLSETRPCVRPTCPENCVWGEWSEWTNCSVTCGNGTRSRTRTKVREENEAGECPEGSVETEVCVMHGGCCPVDCEVGDWEDVSVCTDGTKQQERPIITEPECDGEPCPEPLVRTVACAHSTCVAGSCPCNEVYNYATRDDFGYVLEEPAGLFMGLAGSDSEDGEHTDDIKISRPEAFCVGKVTLEVKCIRRVIMQVNGVEVTRADVDLNTQVSQWTPLTLTTGVCHLEVNRLTLLLKRSLDCGDDLFKDFRELQLEPCVS